MLYSQCFVKCMCGRICGLWETAVPKELPKGLPGLGRPTLADGRLLHFFPETLLRDPQGFSRLMPEAHLQCAASPRCFLWEQEPAWRSITPMTPSACAAFRAAPRVDMRPRPHHRSYAPAPSQKRCSESSFSRLPNP